MWTICNDCLRLRAWADVCLHRQCLSLKHWHQCLPLEQVIFYSRILLDISQFLKIDHEL